MNKYHVLYVEGCEPKLYSTDTVMKREKFIKRFLKKNQDNTDDNWIDLKINGTVELVDRSWKK